MKSVASSIFTTALLAVSTLGTAQTLPQFHVSAEYPIGGEGPWDYISLDQAAHRLYVSHDTRVEVLDMNSGKQLGAVTDTPGVHGAAIASALERGFTSNGSNSSVTIFNTRTLAVVRRVHANSPDFILYDKFSNRVFPMSEKTTVLDANSGDSAGELDLGGEPEAAVADGAGTMYVNIASKGTVAVVDTKRLAITKRFPIEGCTEPTTIAHNADDHRLFIGCQNGFFAIDSASGKLVGRSLMCADPDSSAYDPATHLIFEACKEGVVSVIRAVTPNYYELVDSVRTHVFAKTMAYDAMTHRMFLPVADVVDVPIDDPKEGHTFTLAARPGTFRVLVLSP